MHTVAKSGVEVSPFAFAESYTNCPLHLYNPVWGPCPSSLVPVSSKRWNWGERSPQVSRSSSTSSWVTAALLLLPRFHLQPTAHASSLGPASHTVPGSLHRSSGSLPWKEEVHYLVRVCHASGVCHAPALRVSHASGVCHASALSRYSKHNTPFQKMAYISVPAPHPHGSPASYFPGVCVNLTLFPPFIHPQGRSLCGPFLPILPSSPKFWWDRGSPWGGRRGPRNPARREAHPFPV